MATRRGTGRSGARRLSGGGGQRRGKPAAAWPRPRCAGAGGAGPRRAAVFQPVGVRGGRGAGAAAAGTVHDGARGPGGLRGRPSSSDPAPPATAPPPTPPSAPRACAPPTLPMRAPERGTPGPARGRGEGGRGAGGVAWGRPHKMAAAGLRSRAAGRPAARREVGVTAAVPPPASGSSVALRGTRSGARRRPLLRPVRLSTRVFRRAVPPQREPSRSGQRARGEGGGEGEKGGRHRGSGALQLCRSFVCQQPPS